MTRYSVAQWNRMSRTVTLPASALKTRSTGISQEHVQRYKDPKTHHEAKTPICVTRKANGTYEVQDGNHRVKAAQAQGRSVRVRLNDKLDDKGRVKKGQQRGAGR